MTLADSRNVDPLHFDAIIHAAVHLAAADVGKECVIKALCYPKEPNVTCK